jgi:hypothetical protein
MPHYQALLFGCANPRAGLTDRNRMSEIEMIWDWISQLAEHTGIVLDWPADTAIIAPLASEQTDQDDILGVVVAISEQKARPLDRQVAILGDGLVVYAAGPSTLAELCMPLSADIQTAMLKSTTVA